MFKANILVTLRPSILDPQGKATHHALSNLGLQTVDRIRMGKYVEMWIDEPDEAAARRVADEACRKLLANQVMEDYVISIEVAETVVGR